ncbi:MAG TPA: CPBP family intramembrane glutamic endopeptidase [Thermoguttaceae bacterium]|nr:CPBP family intramembrane glutamic endopeptidase [Thermoguttaceae bacterium]
MSEASPDAVTVPPSDYWHESRKPLTSLVFIAPLLVIYEVGVWLPAGAARNGVDVWLRTFLEWIGFGQYYLLPVLTVCILLAWHYTTREPWRVSWRVLGRMAVECLVLAVFLRLILQLQIAFLQAIMTPAHEATGQSPVGMSLMLSVSERLGNLIMFLGAGIYEELLFRLILLSGAIWTLGRLGVKRPWNVVQAVALTSFVFAVAHYLGPYGEPPRLQSFLFRFVAGVFFCILFVYRGFGIAAGAHAGYDILVGLFPRC